MKTAIKSIASALLLLSFTPATLASETLFNKEYGFDKKQLVESGENRKIKSKHHARINAKLKQSTDIFDINLPDGTISVKKKRSRINKQGSLVWHGAKSNVNGKVNNDTVIIQNEYGITASVYKDGRLFKIQPVSNELHEIVEVDLNNMPKDHPDGEMEILEHNAIDMSVVGDHISTTTINNGQSSTTFTTSNEGNTEITVLVGYTPAASQAYSGNISSLIELAVAETNAGYFNSAVHIDLTLVHSYELDYTESGSFNSDLTAFRNTNDGDMDEVHTLRDQYGADIAMMLIDNPSSCGLASGIGSTASTAFAVAHWGCATGYYSFGHEIGHLQSARHNTEADSTSTPYTYGHGFRNGDEGWRTIMSYDCRPSCATRINWWSDPLNTYNGEAMGTAATNDNARVLDETAATVASFKTGGTGGSGSTPNFSAEVTGLWGYMDSVQGFALDVPSGASNLSISLSGGYGDADLYVGYEYFPDWYYYDCAPQAWGNNEVCTATSPQPGTYYIMVYGYYNYSDVTLSVSYEGTAADSLGNETITRIPEEEIENLKNTKKAKKVKRKAKKRK